MPGVYWTEQGMAICVICQARTNLMLFELREPLCARCLETLREVEIHTAPERDASPSVPRRS